MYRQECAAVRVGTKAKQASRVHRVGHHRGREVTPTAVLLTTANQPWREVHCDPVAWVSDGR